MSSGLSLEKAFPRLKRRGPIEALKTLEAIQFALGFPRLKRRGPIEASILKRRVEVGLPFPRLKRRGPIEASHVGAKSRGSSNVSTSEKTWPH